MLCEQKHTFNVLNMQKKILKFIEKCKEMWMLEKKTQSVMQRNIMIIIISC